MPAEAQLSGPPPVPTRFAEVRVGGLVARTLSTAWKRKWRLAVVTIAFLAPAYALKLAAAAVPLSTFGPVRFAVRVGSELLVAFGVMLLLCAHAHGAVQHLAGRPVRIGAMLRAALGRALPLLGLLAVGVLAAVALGLGVRFLYGILEAALGEDLAPIAVAALVVPTAPVVATAVSLTIPVMTAERVGPLAGLARSWRLTRARRAVILVALSVLGLLYLVILFAELFLVATTLEARAAAALAGAPPRSWLSGDGTAEGFLWVALGIALALVQSLLVPLVTVPAAVAYHDLRLEKEGASPEDLARVFL